MSDTARFWVLIVTVGLGTYALRSLPILLHGHRPVPPWLATLLRHVPAAALAALAVPGSLYLRTDGGYELAPARTIAAAVGLVVALRWRNTVATLVVGMAALWIAQALLGT
ncbi:MAG: AzlD domain-containing protein [Coriobacteriia bacterium]|nr:AzlD domain-containing protein [Coriobacteriia bacterium]